MGYLSRLLVCVVVATSFAAAALAQGDDFIDLSLKDPVKERQQVKIAPSPDSVVETVNNRQAIIYTAMVYRIARFATWPDAREQNPIVLCVSRDTPLYPSLMMLDGKPLEHRRLRTIWLLPETQAECHIAFLSQSDARSEMAMQLATSGVLTVSADRGFSNTGMVELVKIGRQTRFEINNSLAMQSGIHLSSKLLRIAEEVH